MKAFLAFLLIPFSMVVYLLLSQRGIYQHYPAGNLAVMFYGLFLLGLMLWKAPTWWRWVLEAVGVLMVLLFSWWVFIYSEYPEECGGAVAGEVVAGKLAEAKLVDASGKEFKAGEVIGRRRATLLVFYRGWW